MKKQFSILFGAMLAVGLSGAASAGGPSIPCNAEEEICWDTDLLEVSVKCLGSAGLSGGVYLGGGPYGDFLFDVDNYGAYFCDIAGWIDAEKTEIKCQSGGAKKHDGVVAEMEIKNKGYAEECDD